MSTDTLPDQSNTEARSDIARPNRAWLTWETQRRNQSLSRHVQAQLHEFDIAGPAWKRYPKVISKTWRTLRRTRPDLIFAQNPSIVLSFLAVHYGKWTRTPVIVDSHNAGLFPFEGRSRIMNWLAHHILKRADLTLVSNRSLEPEVAKYRGRSFVVPDPIPEFEPLHDPTPLTGQFNILYVCTWSEDEPYDRVLDAAERMPEGTRVHITGSLKKARKRIGDRSHPNIVLTDFLSERDYVNLVQTCDVVTVLTERDDCLCCGAYEAVAATKPMLLSDTKALRKHFSKGAIYTRHDPAAIEEGWIEACEQLDELNRQIKELKQKLVTEFDDIIDELEQQIRKL